jgi:predicted small metal-binding protein
MKKHQSLIALACTLALALSAPLTGRADEKAKSDDKPAASTEPMYSVSCPSPCEFTVKSHDKAELIAAIKAHAKSHHQMDMSDKDVEAMIKVKEPKKN